MVLFVPAAAHCQLGPRDSSTCGRHSGCRTLAEGRILTFCPAGHEVNLEAMSNMDLLLQAAAFLETPAPASGPGTSRGTRAPCETLHLF